RLQQDDQCGRRGDVDSRPNAGLDEAGIVLPGSPEEALVGEEHDNPLGTVRELLPVGLRRELLQMVANLAGVILEPLPSDLVVRRLVSLEVRRERDLRVDDDLLPARKPDDEVGTERSLVRASRDLLGEVAVWEHPSDLNDATQLNLAPAPACMRCAKRVSERCRLLPEGHEVLAQLTVPLCASSIEFLDALPDRAERLLER